jgi:hypothetical protein
MIYSSSTLDFHLTYLQFGNILVDPKSPMVFEPRVEEPTQQPCLNRGSPKLKHSSIEPIVESPPFPK